jgi:hypothetical protein
MLGGEVCGGVLVVRLLFYIAAISIPLEAFSINQIHKYSYFHRSV